MHDDQTLLRLSNFRDASSSFEIVFSFETLETLEQPPRLKADMSKIRKRKGKESLMIGYSEEENSKTQHWKQESSPERKSPKKKEQQMATIFTHFRSV